MNVLVVKNYLNKIMTYEFLVPKKGWTEEKFKKFLKHGANDKIEEISVRGRKNLLHTFTCGTPFNTKGTAFLNQETPERKAEREAKGIRLLHLSPTHETVPRHLYKDLVATGLFYQFYYTSYELDKIREKSYFSNVRLILGFLEGSQEEIRKIERFE